LEGIDDQEIDNVSTVQCNTDMCRRMVRNFVFVSTQMLLSEEEVKIKTQLWFAENADFLKEQEGVWPHSHAT